jgi:hypothetical protein
VCQKILNLARAFNRYKQKTELAQFFLGHPVDVFVMSQSMESRFHCTSATTGLRDVVCAVTITAYCVCVCVCCRKYLLWMCVCCRKYVLWMCVYVCCRMYVLWLCVYVCCRKYVFRMCLFKL